MKGHRIQKEKLEINSKGGNKTMNKLTKKLVSGIVGVGMLVMGMMVGVTQQLFADSNTNNDGAAMVVRIKPNVDRGVEIATGTAGLAGTGEIQLGSVNLGASTQTVNPATVTITSNMSETEIDLSASITGGWVFQNEQVLTSSGANQLNAWVSFTSISTGAVPASDNTEEYFRVGTSSGAKLTSLTNTFSAARVGIGGGSGIGRFENNADGADMDVMAPSTQRHLWTFFRLPPTTSITADQIVNIVLSVTDSGY